MATGRRGKKTATRRKKRKAAPAAKKKARKAKAKPKARKAKPKARARTTAKRKPKPKAKARKVVRKKPTATARGGLVRLRRSAPAPRPEAVPAAVAFTAPAAAPAGDGIQPHVEQELRTRGYEPPDGTVVAVLTAIGRGYAQGPAAAPDWLHVDTAGPIAEGVVERFVTGDRSNDINRVTHRAQVRATVGFNLEQLGGGETGDAEREVLTAFCLGSWDPDTHTNAQRDGVASFVVPWYLAGR